MAIPAQPILPIPAPTAAEAAALQTVRDYLHRAGTHAASRLLGCPDVSGETASIAEFSNTLLSSAALCAGLLDLAGECRRV